MAKISRHSFSCPHCKAVLSSGWGGGTYARFPDQFNCPYCGGFIQLSESQIRQKHYDLTEGQIHGQAFRKDMRGCLVIFICAIPLGLGLGYLWARNNYGRLDAQVWLAVIGIGLVISIVLSGIITFVRSILTDIITNKRKRQKNS